MSHIRFRYLPIHNLYFCRLLLLILLLSPVICPVVCKAHKEPVHQDIAESAVKSSDGFTRFVNESMDGPNTTLLFHPEEFSETNPQRPLYWVVKGAFHEDHAPRYGNHFYVVRPGRTLGAAYGLTDGSEFLGFLPQNTTNSYVWATDPNQLTPTWVGPSTVPNSKNWPSARTYQYEGLTMPSKEDRDEKMAQMFYALGHVIHLNQDVSQPDHARNDEHIPGRDHIEKYGKNKVLNKQPSLFAEQPRGWAYWRDQANFEKLRDFWDRGFYNGNKEAMEAALNADATGVAATKLGLAEFSNGNFLGEDALYGELFSTKEHRHYFPFPSLTKTDQPLLKSIGLSPFLDTTTLKNGMQGQTPYLKKMGAGVTVEKHSALKYLAAVNVGKMDRLPARVAVTIDKNEVLQEYHEKLIPKAIEYSAGILDYFFRGRIDASTPVWSSESPAHYTVTVQNLSGESFKDGAFTLWYDDEDGDRSQVGPAYNLSGNMPSGIMADNATAQITFASSQITDPERFVLVYKGNIGLKTDNTPSDPVDTDVAIAARTITNWHSSFESDSGLPSTGDQLHEGWLVDGQVDIDNRDAYEGERYLDLNGLERGGISVDILTVPGQSYTLSFAYARNPDSIGSVVPEADISVTMGNTTTLLGNVSSSSENSWTNLNWQTTSYPINATATSIHLTFESLTEGASGVLVDAIDLAPN